MPDPILLTIQRGIALKRNRQTHISLQQWKLQRMAWARGGHNLVSISSLFHSLTPNADKNVEPQELVEMQNGIAPLEDTVALSYRTKSTLTI